MTNDDEEKVLVCVEATAPHTINSVERDADCGHPVWVATAGQAFLQQNPDTTVWCLPCALAKGSLDDGNPKQSVPGALEEIDRTLGEDVRAAAERIMVQLGIEPAG